MLFKGKKNSTVNILRAIVSDGKIHLYVYLYDICIQINTYAKKFKVYVHVCVHVYMEILQHMDKQIKHDTLNYPAV